MSESILAGVRNRLLQSVARTAPGATTLRVTLHRWRGVTIGKGVWIGYDVLLETSRPHLIKIGNGVIISMRALLIAHFRGATSITIEDDVFIGPGAIILPDVVIGRGSVITAGSVVSASVPPMSVVQGNPARVIATSTVTLVGSATMDQFKRGLRPVKH
jgi:acetyltransferase-like isoleucine patch superfamily enzyme